MRLRAYVVMCVIAAGCQNDAPPPPEVVPVARAPVAVAPKPTAPKRDVDRSLGDGLEMRRPIRDGRISVIPIVATRPTAAPAYLTLADGMKRGLVTVREMGRDEGFVVDHLRLTNKSKQPLFVIAGELVIEGQQDRVMSADRVIEAGKTVTVTVRCVERHRVAGSVWFKTGEALAELSLRERVVHGEQGAVWAEVAAINARLGLAPPSGTYREAAAQHKTGEAAARRDRMLAALATLEERAQLVGFAVAIDDKVVAVERFASPELYSALETELVGSYTAGTPGDLPHEAHPLEPTDVRAFLAGTAGTSTEASTVVLAQF